MKMQKQTTQQNDFLPNAKRQQQYEKSFIFNIGFCDIQWNMGIESEKNGKTCMKRDKHNSTKNEQQYWPIQVEKYAKLS